MSTFIKYRLNGVNGEVHPTNTIARQIRTAMGKDTTPMEIIRFSLGRELALMVFFLIPKPI